MKFLNKARSEQKPQAFAAVAPDSACGFHRHGVPLLYPGARVHPRFLRPEQLLRYGAALSATV